MNRENGRIFSFQVTAESPLSREKILTEIKVILLDDGEKSGAKNGPRDNPDEKPVVLPEFRFSVVEGKSDLLIANLTSVYERSKVKQTKSKLARQDPV